MQGPTLFSQEYHSCLRRTSSAFRSGLGHCECQKLSGIGGSRLHQKAKFRWTMRLKNFGISFSTVCACICAAISQSALPFRAALTLRQFSQVFGKCSEKTRTFSLCSPGAKSPQVSLESNPEPACPAREKDPTPQEESVN